MKIALFDFDGTLLRGNSWQLFFWWRLRQQPGRAPWLLLALALRAVRVVPSRWLKEQVLAGLGGRTKEEVAAIGRAFAQAVLVPRLRAVGLREIAACRAGGCEPVLITGAFDFLVQPLAEAQGFHHWRATQLEFANGRCTGRIQGCELIGSEKTVQLHELLAGLEINWAGSRAYGDEPADLPALALVGQPFYVRSGRRLPANLPPGCVVVDWDA
jgi:HAD superfamily hydrolase (TIGR01490 family)